MISVRVPRRFEDLGQGNQICWGSFGVFNIHNLHTLAVFDDITDTRSTGRLRLTFSNTFPDRLAILLRHLGPCKIPS